MSRKIVNINDTDNKVILNTDNRKIEVIHTDYPSNINISHPVTNVVEVKTQGPQGPVGPAGIDAVPYLIFTGSVTASVNVDNNIFLVTSESIDYFSLSPVSSSLKTDVFIIRDTLDVELLKISESIYYFNTHSIEPTASAVPGALYFTSNSLFIGLEN